MEENIKIVKVYSNNSKKSRLKRNKNKYQRVWDAEKQTYVKVRKAKYPVNTPNKKKNWREINKEGALKRRQNVVTKAKKKSVPVNAAQMEMKIAKLNKPEKKVVTHVKITNINPKPTSVKLYGKTLSWDSKNLKYKAAA